MTRFLQLTIIILFFIICSKLILDGEWYLVATLLFGLWIERDELERLFNYED